MFSLTLSFAPWAALAHKYGYRAVGGDTTLGGTTCRLGTLNCLLHIGA